MRSFFLDPFSLSFLQRALLAGLFGGISCGVVGTWVVVRRVAFFGEALSHGIVPGVAVATLVGFSPILGAAASAGVMVAGVSGASRVRRVGEETAVGLLFVGMLGLGILIISRSGSFAVDVTALLFGAVLGVRTVDVVVAAGAAAVTVLVTLTGYRAFLAVTVDERVAALSGFSPRRTRVLLLTIVAMAVVASFRTIGALLVVALLVAPAATAVQLTRRVPSTMVVAVLFAWSAVLGGLLASYHLDLAAGGAIAVLAVLQFGLTAALRGLATRRRPGRSAAPVAQRARPGGWPGPRR